jgi:DNA mismatch repair ATPase MutS
MKKISPKAFYTLYNNIISIKEIYDVIMNDVKLIEYLSVFETNILDVDKYCNQITEYINDNIDIELSKDIEQLQNFEINFIRAGVEIELDKKTETLRDSEAKLESIRCYLSDLIENKEKKTSKMKSSDYVKINETEKNNYRIICTSRRCKLLQDALPKEQTPEILTFTTSDNKTKTFQFNISKTQFDFEKQSATNNCIVDEQINELCRNISNIKISMKDTITLVYNKFVERFEVFQQILESIINFITLIDVLHNKSSIAKRYNYCKPIIEKASKSFVNAKQLRHCLIEQFQTNELYVANDIILGNEKTNGMLLYGTNAV